ncbi:conserved unknown protein [Ectocarpus siliculosus]|uniref:Kinesin motor domain-containing protein n=1 Tax=Ectocarpus siliculosus TaxID=2880 RepID=D7G5B6_ECTSI|nr:conserved unknown protein [Ectocarpus siliculosus]|eukprot:CBJ27270.1 conserved unknown protein [Ectocarpus siliculosus]
MSVSIKVAVRCRPFTIDDNLGVNLTQSGEEEGEIDILNSAYSTTRFAFTYAWWSAYGFSRHVKNNATEAAEMELIDQEKVYLSVGKKIKADLLTGNAVVLFAYGLSGSGKTFTVFGPDAVDEPEAWFKHGEPHPLWGIFPRLAYEVFQEKKDGWKITMKYFQNVVDTVRDLMSPVGKEMHYKNGMKKDADGFTDIDWCSSAVLNSWDDLRQAFRAANARKAIAPTQFNHQSTRGHCIMTLEVEMPHPDMPGMKQKGRVYVCDLAGTEPAGDIVYALYEKKTFDGGDIEYKFLGPHQDQRKTKELQDQGKKINLSLSEVQMAQFFMKMAEAVQKNTLKPGGSIPGCNSYFLCKYLKDTMLQARTYLFCAIRPEVTYHKYTFATLGFAKNASVVKLKPKMATVKATLAEKKLMEELEQMKALVEQLRQQQLELAQAPVPQPRPTEEQFAPEPVPETTDAVPATAEGEETPPAAAPESGEDPRDGSGGTKVEVPETETGEVTTGDEPAAAAQDLEESRKRRESIKNNHEQVSRLQEMLEAKQLQLRDVLSGGGEGKTGPTPEERQLEQQKEEYGRRGISLSHFDADTRLPHLVNVDEDPFRHNRFVYLLKKRVTVFGPQGDVQPMSLSVQRKHCTVEVKKAAEKGEKGTVTLVGGRGEVLHNGRRVRKQEQVVLALYDRVAIGGELLLFKWKALETPKAGPPPTAEEAVMEFKKAMQARSGRRRSAEMHAMEEQLKDLQIAKAKAEEEAKSVTKERKGEEEKETSLLFSAEPLDDEQIASVIRSAEDEVQMLLPHVKEAEQFMQLFGRDYLTFDVSLQRSQGDTFEVAASVQVRNERTGQGCYLSSFEFLEQHSIFKDEVAQLQAALDNGREYMVSEEHDPCLLLLQGTHQLGAATLFTEPIVYMMATEDEERFSVIKNVRAPYGEVGKLESSWYPLVLDADGRTVDPEADDGCDVDLPEIDSPKDLIGLPWAYRFDIKAGYNLPLTCASAYCQYDLLGETFTTETVQPDPASNSPALNYSFVHRVDKVTPEVVDQLSKPLNVYLYVGPHVEPEKPEDTITTKNPGLSARFESLCRPSTPVPTASPAGRGGGGRGDPANRGVSPTQHRGSGGIIEGADLGAPSSWGFAAADFAGSGAESGGDVVAAEGGGGGAATAMTSEVAKLTEENASLKKELLRARAEIKRLTKEARGGNAGAQAPGGSGSIGGGGGVATSASTGTLEDGRQKDVDGVNASQVDGGGRKGRKSRTPRESRSRRKINDAIDTARVTDAVVEATVGGGLADPLRPDSGRSTEVG